MAPGRRPNLGRDDLPLPPRIPIIAPGELLTTEIVEYLQQVTAAGGMVEGAADESLEHLRTVIN